MFNELYPKVGIKEDHALNFFLFRLINVLHMHVRMFKPKILTNVYSLAKLQEMIVTTLKE